MPHKTSENMIQTLELYYKEPHLQIATICKMKKVTHSGITAARKKLGLPCRGSDKKSEIDIIAKRLNITPHPPTQKQSQYSNILPQLQDLSKHKNSTPNKKSSHKKSTPKRNNKRNYLAEIEKATD